MLKPNKSRTLTSAQILNTQTEKWIDVSYRYFQTVLYLYLFILSDIILNCFIVYSSTDTKETDELTYRSGELYVPFPSAAKRINRESLVITQESSGGVGHSSCPNLLETSKDARKKRRDNYGLYFPFRKSREKFDKQSTDKTKKSMKKLEKSKQSFSDVSKFEETNNHEIVFDEEDEDEDEDVNSGELYESFPTTPRNNQTPERKGRIFFSSVVFDSTSASDIDDKIHDRNERYQKRKSFKDKLSHVVNELRVSLEEESIQVVTHSLKDERKSFSGFRSCVKRASKVFQQFDGQLEKYTDEDEMIQHFAKSVFTLPLTK